MHPRTLLILSGTLVAAIWQLPYGRHILYPFTLLATYAHEMGHGLSALLVGAEFDHLLLHADGSGMAVWHGNPGPAAKALVAAGGLLGPTLAGICILLLSRSPRWARWIMAGLAVLMAASVVLWSRNVFGATFLLASAATLALCARLLPSVAAAFVLHLMAVLLCLSWFTDLDYMFSAYALVNGVRVPSDSAAMAQALWLPYWFWGGAVAVFSLAMVVLGIGWVSRTPRNA
ncbi:MAG: M50 family metallopeptidase [Burkholderiales bacterium]|nr:M50 family metallopeptidase [Burkholderiales bacterium]